MGQLLNVFPDSAAGMSWSNPNNILADDAAVASITLGASATNTTLQANFSAGLFSTIPAGATGFVLVCTIQWRQLVDAEPTGVGEIKAFLDGAARASVEGPVTLPTSISDSDFTYSYAPDGDDFTGGTFVISCEFTADEDGTGIEVDCIKIKSLTWVDPERDNLLETGCS